MREVDANACTTICLGKQGENLATKVKFRLVYVFRDKFGDGHFALIHQRSGDEAPYPIDFYIDGDAVVWEVSNADTAMVGYGRCELIYYVDEVIAKSVTFATKVLSALSEPTEEPPEPWQSWVDSVLEAGEEARAARDEWANMSAEAETLPPGSDATASYADGVLTIGVPAGIGGTWGTITGDIEDQSDLADVLNAKLGDAPSDGKQYARKDGEWEEVIGGGSTDHSRLVNRDIADQHPISAITGLAEELADKYEKPANGIPKTDLSSAVQTSLWKADSAVQPETGKGLFSGSYNDLTNKPTNVSAFYNDAGYLTSHQSLSAYRTASAQDVIDAGKADIDDIPTKTSDLINDSGFLTEHQSLTGYATEAWVNSKGYGTYTKPSGGIPSSDMASAVQTSLGKADSSVQPDDNVSSLENDAGYQTETDVDALISAHNASDDAHNDIRDSIPTVIDNITSTSVDDALSANQGKLLNDRLNNISARGRYLSLWDCTTGLPLTNPSGYPYAYHTGDYFIVSATGTTNYIPNGSSYEGIASTTVYAYDIKVNDTIYFDGTSWTVFDTPGGGESGIIDVYQNGSSVLSAGIAYVTVPTALSALTTDATHRTVTDTEKSTWNAKGTYSKPSGGIPKSDLASSVQTSLGKADSAVQPETGKGLFSGDYSDLTNKPTNVSEFYNDAGYLTEHQSLSAYRTAAAQDLIDAGKQPTISDLAAIRSGAALGATALQSANDAYLVTYGTTTSAQIEAAVEAGKQPVCFYNDIRYDYVGLSNGYHCFTAVIADTARRLYLKNTWGATSFTIAKTTDIPAEVTESTVAGWGFTKNTGTYSKPSGGIPKSDMESSVQTSLGLADSALQSFTETDPTVPSWAKQTSKPTYTYTEVGAEQSGAVSTHNASSSAHSSLFGAKLNVAQGVAHAGEFMIVGNDGNITTQAFSVLAGGSY